MVLSKGRALPKAVYKKVHINIFFKFLKYFYKFFYFYKHVLFLSFLKFLPTIILIYNTSYQFNNNNNKN